MRACQCQRLPLESKLGRERGISRGYADRMADRSIATPRIAIAQDDGVVWQHRQARESLRAHICFG